MVTPEGPHYRLLARIGAGGFGEVYHAHKVAEGGFRKDVALKVLSAEKADIEEVVSRLKDEARVLALLNHRAIVKVDLLVQLGGRWTVVMEYVEGADLERVLHKHGPVPPFVALEIGAEVSSALDYAWNHEVMDMSEGVASRRPLHLLHRDIKPSNIQLTAHGDVKVLDFGIARAEFDSREARTGDRLLFTQSYAAPERLKGVEHPGGDVFSLGATLCELLTGARLDLLTPYMAALLAQDRSFNRELYLAGRYAELRDALTALPTMSGELLALLLSMVAWEPEDRPTASQLKRDFRKLAAFSQAQQTLPEWCEQVIKPDVDARRQSLAEPSPLDRGPLTGQALVSGSGGGLEVAQTDVERAPVPDLARPTSADSMELTRWQSLAPTVRLAQAKPGDPQRSEDASAAPEASEPEEETRGGSRAVAYVAGAALLAIIAISFMFIGPNGRHIADADPSGAAAASGADVSSLTQGVSSDGVTDVSTDGSTDVSTGEVGHASENVSAARAEGSRSSPAGAAGASSASSPSAGSPSSSGAPSSAGAASPEGASVGTSAPASSGGPSPERGGDVTPSAAADRAAKAQPAASAAPAPGRVRLSGAATSAVLRSSAGSVSVPAAGAAVAAGAYQVSVTLEDGRTLTDVMTLTVEPDQDLTVFCPGWTPSCSLKP